MTERVRINHREGKWQIKARMDDQAPNADWLALGGCPDRRVAVRLWLALMSMERR